MIPAWAAKYTMIPFADRGRDFTGADCWGIPVLAYREERGIMLPEYGDGYTTIADRAEIAALVEAGRGNWPWQLVARPAPFDLALFWLTDHYHFGLMVDRVHMIHAVPDTPSQICRADSPIWSRRLQGYFRHAELAA